MNSKNKKMEPEKWHIHKIADQQNLTMKQALEKYGHLKDEKGFVLKSELSMGAL